MGESDGQALVVWTPATRQGRLVLIDIGIEEAQRIYALMGGGRLIVMPSGSVAAATARSR